MLSTLLFHKKEARAIAKMNEPLTGLLLGFESVSKSPCKVNPICENDHFVPDSQ